MINNCIKKLQSILYPPICALCGNPGKTNLDLCAHCYDDLPWNRHACVRCAEPLPPAREHGCCGRCQKQDPPDAPIIERTICAFKYEYPADHLIKQFKFQQRLGYGRLLGALLVEKIASENTILPQALIPVPLYRARQQQRGFNQSLEIANNLSKALNIPVCNDICIREKNTQTQSRLPLKARRQNLKNAFHITAPVVPEHVVIVDDVITSGTTVTTLATALRKAGVEKIEVWALARRE